MSPLVFALALFLADAPAADPAPAAPAAAEAQPLPPGAPADDYQFVGWCYGVLRGYLDLHDEVMPEVTRIESTWRAPGSNLADDLKVYAEMQKTGEKQLVQFQDALTAAEKASLKPINALGAQAVRKGHAMWNAGPEVTEARKAQEWMSWSLPARCETTAKALKKRATLMGAAFQVNADPDKSGAAVPPADEAITPAEAPPAVEAAPAAPQDEAPPST